MSLDPSPRKIKKNLRREVASLIRGLPQDLRAAEERSILQAVSTVLSSADAHSILLYVRAFPEEIDTTVLVASVLGAGKRLILPRVDRLAVRLRLFDVSDPAEQLRPGVLGIPEPDHTCREIDPLEVDWALIPGLAFDERFYRLGRGAGHYDRLIPRLRPAVPCWSAALICQMIDRLPAERHDVPLDGIVTAQRLWSNRVGRRHHHPPLTSTEGGVE